MSSGRFVELRAQRDECFRIQRRDNITTELVARCLDISTADLNAWFHRVSTAELLSDQDESISRKVATWIDERKDRAVLGHRQVSEKSSLTTMLPLQSYHPALHIVFGSHRKTVDCNLLDPSASQRKRVYRGALGATVSNREREGNSVISAYQPLRDESALAVPLVSLFLLVSNGSQIVREQLLWDLRDTSLTPKSFAYTLCEDLGVPVDKFAIPIAQSIASQLATYQPYVHAKQWHAAPLHPDKDKMQTGRPQQGPIPITDMLTSLPLITVGQGGEIVRDEPELSLNWKRTSGATEIDIAIRTADDLGLSGDVAASYAAMLTAKLYTVRSAIASTIADGTDRSTINVEGGGAIQPHVTIRTLRPPVLHTTPHTNSDAPPLPGISMFRDPVDQHRATPQARHAFNRAELNDAYLRVRQDAEQWSRLPDFQPGAEKWEQQRGERAVDQAVHSLDDPPSDTWRPEMELRRTKQYGRTIPAPCGVQLTPHEFLAAEKVAGTALRSLNLGTLPEYGLPDTVGTTNPRVGNGALIEQLGSHTLVQPDISILPDYVPSSLQNTGRPTSQRIKLSSLPRTKRMFPLGSFHDGGLCTAGSVGRTLPHISLRIKQLEYKGDDKAAKSRNKKLKQARGKRQNTRSLSNALATSRRAETRAKDMIVMSGVKMNLTDPPTDGFVLYSREMRRSVEAGHPPTEFDDMITYTAHINQLLARQWFALDEAQRKEHHERARTYFDQVVQANKRQRV